ncbi:MAG: hypothetical protein MJK04_36790, partial [Psychrosphaera sp.]|nr:hypothetical protein [Psychrosphaera sp.]
MAFAGAAGKVWGKNQINSVRKRSLGEQRYWVDKKLEPYTYSSVLSSPLSIVLSTVDGRDTFALPKLQLELVKFLSLNPSSSVVARQFFENLIAYLRHKDTIQQSFNDWQQKKAIHLRHAELGLFDPSFYVYLENAEPWHSESYWPGRIFSGSVSGRLLKASPKSKHFDSDEIETLAYQRCVNRLKTLNIDDKSYN